MAVSIPVSKATKRAIARSVGRSVDEALGRAIGQIPSKLYWLLGKGKTRPDEPLYAAQLLDRATGAILAEAEADDLADAIAAAVAKLNN